MTRPAPDPEPAAFLIPEESDGFRADRALARAFPEWSRQQLKICFAQAHVYRNGQPLAAKSKVRAGESLQVILPTPKNTTLVAVDMPLAILFEDADLVVVDKAAGMITHPGSNTGDRTLVHALLHHTGGQLATAGGDQRAGVVHRLDKDTSGAIVFAKTDAAYHGLTRAFAGRSIAKEYLALVHGRPALESGTLRGAIGRHPGNRVKMAVGDHGKPAHTDWAVERRLGEAFTLLRCYLHTGRTHQIRVHLSDLGFPIAGDTTYGSNRAAVPTGFPTRLMLHAEKLAFNHPTTGNPLAFHAPLPPEFNWRPEKLI